MTADDRRQRGAALCERLATRVAEISPPGLGKWDRTWEIVAGPSAEYMAALTAWEAEETRATFDALEAAYVELIRAWRRAAAAYQDRGEVRR